MQKIRDKNNKKADYIKSNLWTVCGQGAGLGPGQGPVLRIPSYRNYRPLITATSSTRLRPFKFLLGRVDYLKPVIVVYNVLALLMKCAIFLWVLTK